jgi:hypothetical protein
MKSKAAKMLMGAGLVVIILSIAGCQEQTETDTKKARLVGAENMQLKKDLDKCHVDLAKEKELRASEADQLAKDQERIKELEKNTTEYLQQQVESVVAALVEETAKFQQENIVLRERIAELEKQSGSVQP